jgi:hypothetical protein
MQNKQFQIWAKENEYPMIYKVTFSMRASKSVKDALDKIQVKPGVISDRVLYYYKLLQTQHGSDYIKNLGEDQKEALQRKIELQTYREQYVKAHAEKSAELSKLNHQLVVYKSEFSGDNKRFITWLNGEFSWELALPIAVLAIILAASCVSIFAVKGMNGWIYGFLIAIVAFALDVIFSETVKSAFADQSLAVIKEYVSKNIINQDSEDVCVSPYGLISKKLGSGRKANKATSRVLLASTVVFAIILGYTVGVGMLLKIATVSGIVILPNIFLHFVGQWFRTGYKPALVSRMLKDHKEDYSEWLDKLSRCRQEIKVLEQKIEDAEYLNRIFERKCQDSIRFVNEIIANFGVEIVVGYDQLYSDGEMIIRDDVMLLSLLYAIRPEIVTSQYELIEALVAAVNSARFNGTADSDKKAYAIGLLNKYYPDAIGKIGSEFIIHDPLNLVDGRKIVKITQDDLGIAYRSSQSVEDHDPDNLNRVIDLRKRQKRLRF